MGLELKALEIAVNRVQLRVDLQGGRGARIYRARRKAGPYDEVGIAFEDVYVDATDLVPGKTYYYRAVSWTAPHGYPEPGQWDGPAPVAARVPRAPKERRVTLAERRETFAIDVGGFLDESNTVTKGPETYCPGPNSSMPPYEQVFEPNLYVAIENVGETDVVNPWLVANGQRDWWSVETMCREIRGGRRLTETEKAMSIWQFVVDEVYDSRCGRAWYDDLADPVKLLNVYGFEGCVANAIVSRRLAEAMGLTAREVVIGGMLDGYGRFRSCSHDIFEAYTDGAWHMLDTDLMVFFLKRDNRTVACAEDLARDLDLLRRSHRNLGLCGRDLAEKEFYYQQLLDREFLYPPHKGGGWTDESGKFVHAPGEYPPPHRMALRLRPGEKLMRYWDDVGKCVVRGRRLHPDVRYSNGKLVYRPDLRSPLALKGVENTTNLVQELRGRRAALRPSRPGKRAEVVWKIESPYAIAGARVGFTGRRKSQEDGFEVLLSRDGRDWRSVWAAAGHQLNACIELDWYLNPTFNDWREELDMGWNRGPCYRYYIKVALWPGSGVDGVGLDTVWFDTDLQCATRSLPSLFCGRNTIAYRDDTRGPREVRVTYGWQEEHSVQPPDAPELVFPEPGSHVQALDFGFRWRGPKVDDYHIQVSRCPDFRWCVWPTFDRYVGRTAYAGQTQWRPQFPNLLNPDETYYWRVRARSEHGVWSEWSDACAFTPHGPRHPVDLVLRRRGKRPMLVWSPNPAGNPPVEFRVYASDEPGGFSVSEDCLTGTTAESAWPVRKRRDGRHTYYRVVAVDANGVPSTPSDCVAV